MMTYGSVGYYAERLSGVRPDDRRAMAISLVAAAVDAPSDEDAVKVERVGAVLDALDEVAAS